MVTIQTILRRSIKAVCGANERQITLDPSEVSEVKRVLKANGFFIVGQGPAGFDSVNLWFNPIGGTLF